MNLLALAWRSLRREWRLADVRTLALALTLAVTALGVVSTLATRVENGIRAGASQLIGGDIGVSAAAPLPPALAQHATALGLAVSAGASFPSVAFAGEHSQLLDVTAVDRAWPLRGEQRLNDGSGATRTGHGPAPGTVYLDSRALTGLGVKPGDRVQLGGSELRVAATLVSQPDGGQLLALAPRAQMSLADATAAGLLGQGSRARHRLLVAGTPARMAQWQAWATPRLPHGAELITPEKTQQRMQQAFARANAFLRLTALLAALLAGVAIALAAQRYARRKTDEVALLRALGTPRRRVLGLLLATLALLALPAAGLGVALSLGLAQLAWQALHALFGDTPASLPLLPSLASMLVGLAVLAGFALPPLARLAEVPPVAVFRREFGHAGRRFDMLYLLPAAVSLLLLWWMGGSVKLAAILAACLTGVSLLALGLTLVLLWAARRLAPNVHPAWRLGLAALARRRRLSLIQSTALSLGLTALLLLGVVAPALLDGWRRELPPDTPNWFALNLQDTQRDGFATALAAAGANGLNMLPLATGKLVAINAVPVDQLRFTDPRATEWVDRQLRLSWSATLPPANRLLEGRWFQPQTPHAGVSVDEMWRDMFALKLGDVMRFEFGGTRLDARIDSFRAVDWRSFRVNFFLLLDPAHAAALPHSWIASFHLPAGNGERLAGLSHTYPNLSLIDVDSVLDRLRGIIEQVSAAVRWVLGFSLLAGALVLLAALAASAAERRHEAALLRTLGAQRNQLRLAAACEFALLGLTAGAIAVLGASVAGVWLAHAVFRIEHFLPPLPTLLSIALGAAVAVTLLGLAGTRRVAATPPLSLLRRG
ncbi:MAG TPA: FtsX-like permease family protein [Rhodanobacteraceae bacterium]|nr:FtsX-like permease family protein [Rhodanobacteraceae bacterium]